MPSYILGEGALAFSGYVRLLPWIDSWMESRRSISCHKPWNQFGIHSPYSHGVMWIGRGDSWMDSTSICGHSRTHSIWSFNLFFTCVLLFNLHTINGHALDWYCAGMQVKLCTGMRKIPYLLADMSFLDVHLLPSELSVSGRRALLHAIVSSLPRTVLFANTDALCQVCTWWVIFF